MNPQNLLMLELTCDHLGDLVDEVVFVGGATVELWITDQAAPEFRLTEDVDVVVEVTTRQDYYRLEERLRDHGFENDRESGVGRRYGRCLRHICWRRSSRLSRAAVSSISTEAKTGAMS